MKQTNKVNTLALLTHFDYTIVDFISINICSDFKIFLHIIFHSLNFNHLKRRRKKRESTKSENKQGHPNVVHIPDPGDTQNSPNPFAFAHIHSAARKSSGNLLCPALTLSIWSLQLVLDKQLRATI